MQDSLGLNNFISGEVRLFQVYHPQNQMARVMPPHTTVQGVQVPGMWNPANDWNHNTLIVDAAVIMQKLLRNAPDGQWHVAGMYIEFDNSGSTVNPVPTINVEDGLAYYNTLNSGDPNRDYLRVPMTATSDSSGDATKYPLGNIASFIAQTAGATGVHGNTFSAGANSLVYGGALVAFVDSGDSAQDLVWSRFYLPPAQQVAKVASSQIGITWNMTFTES
jgi:hypothetical protein